MSVKTATILWLRQDLRLADNAALVWAANRGAVIPLYIYDTDKDNPFPMGGASKWWLNKALKVLAGDFEKIGTKLILREGPVEKVLRAIARETGSKTIAWNKVYDPYLRQRDGKLIETLEEDGFEIKTDEGFLLFDPEKIKTGSGTPFKVYTPFSKACFAATPPAKALSAPKTLETISGIKSETLKDWKLVPRTAKWPKGLADAWAVGEKAAHKQLNEFVKNTLQHYKNGRDRPDKDFTSRLSPYLHFGHISPRQVWHAIQFANAKAPAHGSSAERFLLELLWREFSWHLLYHIPDLTNEPLNKSFADFPWKRDAKGLHAWQQGMTGYPIVDAGMRQLWQTGWMHNRVRMIVASFLIKDLLIDWREGAAWFWDTLVDADLGNNTASWQWVAGCGADASPYFRIFNPILQGQKFDPDGNYVRKYVPELARLDADFIHEPWKVPPPILAKAGVTLGKTYPHPIIDHGKARQRALEALKKTKSASGQTTEKHDLFDLL